MLIRLITSFFGLIVFFAVLFIPSNIPFNIAVCVVIGVMLFEVYKSIKTDKILYITGYVSAILILISVFNNSVQISVMLSISIALYLIAAVFLHGRTGYKSITSNCLLTYYITYFMGSLILTRNQYGVFAALLIFICAWITDSGAYFTGRFLGRTKLIPKVSPKKTVEGAIGGVISCIIIVVIYTHGLKLVEAHNIFLTILFAAIASVLSQFGDLIASSIKRDCGVKDFGNILPGHGGLTDRFDSVLFISPFVYYFLSII